MHRSHDQFLQQHAALEQEHQRIYTLYQHTLSERDHCKHTIEIHEQIIVTLEQTVSRARQEHNEAHEQTIAELEQSVIVALQHADAVTTEKQAWLYQHQQVTSDHALAMVINDDTCCLSHRFVSLSYNSLSIR